MHLTHHPLAVLLQVPASLAEAISTLMATPSTLNAAAALSQQLAALLAVLEPALHLLRPPDQTAKRKQQPGNSRIIAKQLSASGLMQQLPAALQQAQQQLQKLQLGGTSGGAGNSTAAEAAPWQAGLLGLCAQLISFWPKGALQSAALGPSLVAAAELALASLQYACKYTSQHSSSNAPRQALAALGKAALGVCCVLCGAAASFFYSSPEAVDHGDANMNKHAQTMLGHAAMVSAMNAAVSAGLYGELLSDLITAAQAPTPTDTNSSSSSSRDALGPWTVSEQQLQAAVDLSEDLPAAAWELLSAQEGQLKAGQALLPALQQQLMEAMGCSSKGFLWVAAQWVSEPEGGLAGELKVRQLLMIALQVCRL